MTQLARNNMHIGWRTAGRTFTAMCGHKVKKGEPYFVFDDYFCGTRHHSSQCQKCTAQKEGYAPPKEWDGGLSKKEQLKVEA